MKKIYKFFYDFFQTLFQEKFKTFRSGFIGGGFVSLSFLFSGKDYGIDIIWIFPLKMVLSFGFAFSTGVATLLAKDAYNDIIRKRIFKKKDESKKEDSEIINNSDKEPL